MGDFKLRRGYFQGRVNALASVGVDIGGGEGELTETPRGLHGLGEQVGLLNSLPALEAALERLS